MEKSGRKIIRYLSQLIQLFRLHVFIRNLLVCSRQQRPLVRMRSFEPLFVSWTKKLCLCSSCWCSIYLFVPSAVLLVFWRLAKSPSVVSIGSGRRYETWRQCNGTASNRGAFATSNIQQRQQTKIVDTHCLWLFSRHAHADITSSVCVVSCVLDFADVVRCKL